MAHGDVPTDCHAEVVREMDNRPVLDVRLISYGDGVYIGPQHAAWPNASPFSQGYVANDDRLLRNVGRVGDFRIFVQVLFETFFYGHWSDELLAIESRTLVGRVSD